MEPRALCDFFEFSPDKRNNVKQTVAAQQLPNGHGLALAQATQLPWHGRWGHGKDIQQVGQKVTVLILIKTY